MTQAAQGKGGPGSGEIPSLRCSHLVEDCLLVLKKLTVRRVLKKERREEKKQESERRKVTKKGKGRKKNIRK